MTPLFRNFSLILFLCLAESQTLTLYILLIMTSEVNARALYSRARSETQADPTRARASFPYLPNQCVIRDLLVRGRSISQGKACGNDVP